MAVKAACNYSITDTSGRWFPITLSLAKGRPLCNPLRLFHHLAIRCTAAGAVLRDSDWNKVTCPDCHTKRRGRSKLNKIALIISGVFLLFFVSCVGLIIGLSGNDPSPSSPCGSSSTGYSEQIHLATTSIKSYRMVQDAAVTQRGRQVSLVVVLAQRPVNNTHGK